MRPYFCDAGETEPLWWLITDSTNGAYFAALPAVEFIKSHRPGATPAFDELSRDVTEAARDDESRESMKRLPVERPEGFRYLRRAATLRRRP